MNTSNPQSFSNLLNHRVLLMAMICGLMTNASGCGIPGRRSAESIPNLPAAYALNNGMFAWTPPSTTSPPETLDSNIKVDPNLYQEEIDEEEEELDEEDAMREEMDLEETRSNRRGYQPAVKSASFVSPVSQEDEDGGAKARKVQDEIDRMQSEVTESTSPKEPERDDSTRADDADSSNDSSTESSEQGDDGQSMTEYAEASFMNDTFNNSAQLPKDALYSDPFLMSLINDTLAGNRELKILSEEIQIACNEAYARSGEYRPFVTLGAGAGYEKSSRHTREGAVENQLLVADGQPFPDPLGDFFTKADVSWEIDIWRKLRNSQRAAAFRYLGTQEGRNFIITRVVAEVAENYYELLALDNRLITAQRTIEIQQQSLLIARSKKKAGRATELAVKRFEAEVAKNTAELSIIRQEIVEVENRINLLAGRYPQPVDRISGEFIDLNLGTLATGVPSELLLNRADIREAERQVVAAGLDIEVARARFYPSLSLSAGVGWNAFRTGYLFRTPESLIYGLANELVGPLINKRAIQADYRSANAAQLQTIYQYQQTVLEAHIEVVNQITKVENFRQSIFNKKQQLDALQASVEAANRLFQNARAEYVEVLLAQRELQEARMLLIDIKKEQLFAVVNAYQALGGGSF